MAGKYFGIPFALSGDRSAIPDAAQPDGSVSFTQGFTLDYELENTSPNYKPVPREETNALYHDITESIGIVQKQGFADWTITAAPYPINAFVRHNDIVWRNTIAANSVEPGTDSTWSNETIPSIDYLNTQRIDVASASTIDLTASATNTRHIRITGSVAITGFTLAAGQCYFVSFSGSATLTNNAAIVTNRGANIVTAAGDSCIIRATATNTVEIICYRRGTEWVSSSPQAITLAGLVTIPHGLGVRPDEFDVAIVCTVANRNWVPGDVIERMPFFSQSFPNGDGMISWADATNIYVRYGNTGVSVMDKTTGQVDRITTTSWQMVAKWKRQ